MGKTERHERLRAARIAAGFERQRDVYERFPAWNKNSYKSNENGNAPFSFDQAKTYARAFGVRAEWLYAGTGPMREPGEAGRTVRLIGYVGAGSVAHYYATADDGLGEVDAPDDATETTVAAEIRGVSLGPALDGWLVFFDEQRFPVTPDLHGQLCVVGLPDDRVLVKVLRPAGAPNRFHLISNGSEEPIFDQEVLWAAKVTGMKPR